MKHQAWFAAVVVALLLSARPAQAQQSFDVNLGYFSTSSEDGRADGDVLVINRSYLLFDIDEFAGFYGEGAWSMELGKYFEASVGFGGFQRTVYSVYADYVHDDGREIVQELKLRNLPLTTTVKLFPMGHRRVVQPYVGVGLGVNFWRYSETGEFVDFWDDSIYRESYVASGTAFGPIGSFGVRARMLDHADLGLELRYQWAEGELTDDFLGDKIDLGGYSILSTIKLRF